MTYLEITLFITTSISITGWIVNVKDRWTAEKQLDISSECCNRYLKRIRLLEGEILVLRLDAKPKHLDDGKRIKLYELFTKDGEKVAVFFNSDIALNCSCFLNGKFPTYGIKLKINSK